MSLRWVTRGACCYCRGGLLLLPLPLPLLPLPLLLLPLLLLPLLLLHPAVHSDRRRGQGWQARLTLTRSLAMTTRLAKTRSLAGPLCCCFRPEVLQAVPPVSIQARPACS